MELDFGCIHNKMASLYLRQMGGSIASGAVAAASATKDSGDD
jgi:hypothetical protein